MSSRRSRSMESGSSRISDDQILDLVAKLQQLVPEIRNRRLDKEDKETITWKGKVYDRFREGDSISFLVQVSAAKVLEETCNYIRNLHKEVDDLSERLSELFATTDTAQAELIRNLLMQ